MIKEPNIQTKAKPAKVETIKEKQETQVEIKCSKCENRNHLVIRDLNITNEYKYLLQLPNTNNSFEGIEGIKDDQKPCQIKTLSGNDQISLKSELLHNKLI